MKCDKSGLVRCVSRPVINYCLNNVTADVRRQLDALDLTAVEDYCLQRCGDCFAGPFLVVDGRLVTGDSHAQILRKVERELKGTGGTEGTGGSEGTGGTKAFPIPLVL